MINAALISSGSKELRELLEWCALYMAVADQQFTQAEQNWVDVYFGQGTSERFIQQLATIDWPQTLERTRQLGASLTADERNIIDGGMREWLTQMLSIESLNDEELQRLNEFMAYLEIPSATDVVQETLPPIIEGNPEPLPPIVTVDSEPEHSFVDANIGQNPPTPESAIPEPEPPPPPPRDHDIQETNEPPPMPQSQKRELPTKEIHVSRDDEKYGPYSLDKLNKYLADGVIESSDMAWHKGLSDWVAVQEIEGVILPRNQSAPSIQAQKTDEPPPRHVPNDPPLRREHHLPQTQQPLTASGEIEYYEDSENGVLVTSSRYVVTDDLGNPITYAIKNITSVTTGTYEVESEDGCIKTIAGVIGCGIVIFVVGYFGFYWWVYILGFLVVYGVIAALFDGDGEYYYSVDNVTASGNQQSYTSVNKEEIDAIVEALNNAIING